MQRHYSYLDWVAMLPVARVGTLVVSSVTLVARLIDHVPKQAETCADC
jgi:hypothetical protein